MGVLLQAGGHMGPHPTFRNRILVLKLVGLSATSCYLRQSRIAFGTTPSRDLFFVCLCDFRGSKIVGIDHGSVCHCWLANSDLGKRTSHSLNNTKKARPESNSGRA